MWEILIVRNCSGSYLLVADRRDGLDGIVVGTIEPDDSEAFQQQAVRASESGQAALMQLDDEVNARYRHRIRA